MELSKNENNCISVSFERLFLLFCKSKLGLAVVIRRLSF